METLRLYDYAASANCFKVRLLLATLGRPYERVPVDIFAGETLGDDYYRINPARTTPVLEVGEGKFLRESNAILSYLAEGTPLLPEDRFLRAQTLRWLLFEQADVVPTMGGLRFRVLTGRLRPDDPEARRRHEAAKETLGVLDSSLGDVAFFVADTYTIADIALYGYVHVAHEGGIDMSPYGRVRSWLARVEAQPGLMNDLEPYPANARAGASTSIYDPVKES
jgi:glutathione S-transferase